MIGKFIEVMKKGVNDYKPTVIAIDKDNVSTAIVALKISMLLVEDGYEASGTTLKYASKIPEGKAVRWDFTTNFDLLKSPTITMKGDAKELVFMNDGGETSVYGNDDNADTLKTALALIEATKSNMVPGGEWKDGKFSAMPGGAMEVDTIGNLTLSTKECKSFIEPDQVNDYLKVVADGRAIEVLHNSKCMVYVFKLSDKVCLVQKSKILEKKGSKKMNEEKAANPAAPAVQTATAPATTDTAVSTPVVATAIQPTTPPAPQVNGAPTGLQASDKEPDMDDALEALSNLDNIAAAVKTQTRIVRAVLKTMSKKAPSKDLEAKYAELKKKIDNLKASL